MCLYKCHMLFTAFSISAITPAALIRLVIDTFFSSISFPYFFFSPVHLAGYTTLISCLWLCFFLCMSVSKKFKLGFTSAASTHTCCLCFSHYVSHRNTFAMGGDIPSHLSLNACQIFANTAKIDVMKKVSVKVYQCFLHNDYVMYS